MESQFGAALRDVRVLINLHLWQKESVCQGLIFTTIDESSEITTEISFENHDDANPIGHRCRFLHLVVQGR